MTTEEARTYDQRIACVISKVLGFEQHSEGRVEILDEKTLQVVGQPKIGGIPLEDAVPHQYSIEHIVEIIPLGE